MRYFYAGAAVLALLFVGLGVECYTVRCEHCQRPVFRTSLTTVLYGAHKGIIHAQCFPAFLAARFPASIPPVAPLPVEASSEGQTAI